MRILFLCSSLEKEKDGIGDYTRRLAEAIQNRGNQILLLSFNDKYIKEEANEEEVVSVIRIPQHFSWKQKKEKVTSIIHKFKPDWISIQFISYGIQYRGIVFNAIPFFRNITRGYKVQVMLHELWIAEEKEASLKDKLIGKIQKVAILGFIKKIRPLVINTSIPLYNLILKRNKVNASVLPLFSNIAVTSDSNLEWIWEAINKKSGITINKTHRAEFLIGGIFGSLYYSSWNLQSLMMQLQKTQRKVIILSFGKLGTTEKYWEEIKSNYKSFSFLALGPLPEVKVSQCIQAIDFGIITTPVLIAGKSGSFMAMKEHGVISLGKKSDISFNFPLDLDNLVDTYLQQVGEEQLIFDSDLLKKKPSPQLKNTVSQFLNELKTH